MLAPRYSLIRRRRRHVRRPVEPAPGERRIRRGRREAIEPVGAPAQRVEIGERAAPRAIARRQSVGARRRIENAGTAVAVRRVRNGADRRVQAVRGREHGSVRDAGTEPDGDLRRCECRQRGEKAGEQDPGGGADHEVRRQSTPDAHGGARTPDAARAAARRRSSCVNHRGAKLFAPALVPSRVRLVELSGRVTQAWAYAPRMMRY
jgi:hypothetical protein